MRDGLTIERVRSLIALCRLEEGCVKYAGAIDDSLLALGVEHGVGAWCYYRIKNKFVIGVELNDIDRWKKLYFSTSIHNLQKFKVFSTIQELLKKENITVLALKGTALANTIYPDEGLRPMGDVDLLIPEDKGMEVLQLLLDNGAQMGHLPRSPLHEKVHAHMRATTFKGVLIEPHKWLFSLGNPFHLSKCKTINHFKEVEKQGVKFNVLDDVFMGYHLTAHAAGNINMGGLRLGWLVDIALLLKKQDNLEVFVNEVLGLQPSKEQRIRSIFKMAALLLPEHLQGLLFSPEEKDAITDEVFHWMKKRNVERKHKLINMGEIWHTPGLMNKMRLTFREFFPSEEYMYKWYGSKQTKLWRLYVKRLTGFYK